MGFFSKLISKVSETLSPENIVEKISNIKDTIFGRAAEHVGLSTETISNVDKLIESRTGAEYKSYLNPVVPSYEELNPLVADHSAYVPAAFNLQGNYISNFIGIGTDPLTGEDTITSFSITSDELLTDQDVLDAIEEFTGPSGDYNISDWEFIDGNTSLEEEMF
jgi:hypothetical protein